MNHAGRVLLHPGSASFNSLHSNPYNQRRPPTHANPTHTLVGRVFLHPGSVNFNCGKFESGWLAYSEIVETSKVGLRGGGMVGCAHPYMPMHAVGCVVGLLLSQIAAV